MSSIDSNFLITILIKCNTFDGCRPDVNSYPVHTFTFFALSDTSVKRKGKNIYLFLK